MKTNLHSVLAVVVCLVLLPVVSSGAVVYQFQNLGSIPGGLLFKAKQINDSGQVSGEYSVVGPTGTLVKRSFFWSKQSGMIEIGAGVSGEVNAKSINSQGQVIGELKTTKSSFSWTPASGMAGVTFPGASEIKAEWINDSGKVVGEYKIGVSKGAFLWTSPGPATDLGSIGGTEHKAKRVTAGGIVIGDAKGVPVPGLSGVIDERAFIHDSTNGLRAIHTPSDQLTWGKTKAEWAREDGTVYGEFSDLANVLTVTKIKDDGTTEVKNEAQTRAFVWNNGLFTALDVFENQAKAKIKQANASGQAIGEWTDVSGIKYAFYWDGSQAVQLPGFDGAVDTKAEVIRDDGTILGSSRFSDGTAKAFLYDVSGDAPVMTDLQALLDPVTSAGWTLTEIKGMSADGAIVATGLYQGQMQAVLLEPLTHTPEPGAVLLLAGLACLGTRRRLRKR